ncbi:MAG: hypothetical protein F2923_07990 [Actinobacteria bacterium]|uniref:Unannotated protein n=1 Tax=freshwater metagenome TaxID=449393 RepID=A0A6J7SQ60_9ZZZZ|nr:hypothetical protein [Actinomycetota bacterium]
MSTNSGAPNEEEAWRSIVADLSQDPDLKRHTFITPQTPAAPVEPQPDADDEFIDELLSNEHEEFEPPDPGPLELPAHPIARFAWAGALGGPVLLILSNVFGFGKFVSGIALAASVIGFVTLIARHSDERDDNGDNGAVV